MQVSKADIQKELVHRSLMYFIKFTFEDYEFNWHHLILIQKLDAFARGEIKKLMVFMPPQHGKSEIVSRRFPAYMLGLNPDLNIACCSYSIDLARKFNKAVQRIILEPPYDHFFPNTKLASTVKDTKVNYTQNTDEFDIVGYKGKYKSVGVMGGLTGNRVDLGIIDDPVKDSQEAQSERYRQRAWDWYTDVFLTRLHNDSQILFTMTRWHEDDLAGRILEKEDDWVIVRFPAIKEDNQNDDDPREIGEALWESRHKRERLLNVKKNSERTWASLYQQRPAPLDGDLIKREWFRYYRPDGKYHIVKGYIDGAYTSDKNNDPTVLMLYYVDDQGVKIVRSYVWRLEFPELIKRLTLTLNKFDGKRTKIYIEPKASGLSMYQTLRKEGFNVHKDQPPTDTKISRVQGASVYWEEGKLFFPEDQDSWVDPLIRECLKFPNAKHDDQVDCLTAITRIELVNASKIRARYV